MNARKPMTPPPAGTPTGKTFGNAEAAETGNLLAELRGGESSGPDVVTLARPKRRLKAQNVIVAAVIALSVGALYTMRLYGMGAGMSFDVTPIDYPLDGAGSRLSAEQKRILRDLQLGNEPIRLAMAQIRKNPFRLETDEVEVISPVQTGPTLSDREAEREREIASALAKLQLNGVMLGRIPLARINSRIYKIGDTVEGVFQIKAIQDRTVELAVGERVFAITIGEPENKNP